jgi:serine phosphatase RsbU (regulator of sigma subunit)
MDELTRLQDENKRLRQAVDELSILNDLARVISSTMSVEAVIENVVKRSVRAVHGQQGMINLVNEAEPTVMKTLIRAQDSTASLPQLHLHQNILGWMLINKKPLLSADLANDPRFGGVHVDADQQSALSVPLIVKNRLIGILTIFNKKEGGTFNEQDQRLLAIIATQSAQILESARLYEQEKSLVTMQEQVKLASNIQMGLLPKELPKIPGYDVAGKSIPAGEVGGDYFDFIPIDENRMAICLGDVSGKGVPASLLMANLQATLRGQTLGTVTAKDCIIRSNKLLHESTSSEKFVTLFYAILDTQKHQMLYCNAGHDHPYLISSAGEIRRLKIGGIVLGIMEPFPFDEDTVSFDAGDLLVIYSDGVPEALNAHREFFTDGRLALLLKDLRTLPASEILEKVVSEIKTFAGAYPQSDDVTLVVVKRNQA